MIEQTELVVTEWHYHPPAVPIGPEAKTSHATAFYVMKKTAPAKKGIACRFSCRYVIDDATILEYTGEDSYVIDPDDIIDKKELLTMIRNSFSKFKEKFDLRKLSTVLYDQTLSPLDEYKINLDAILPLLNN
jgi:hypothetical protein